MRESYIEKRGCEDLLALFGIVSIKVGYDGWLDRLCLVGDGRHFWIEYKAPGGQLEPAQRVRIAELEALGDTVYVCESRNEAVLAAENFLHKGPKAAQLPLPLPGGRRKANGRG